jgi:hypothetical protein
MVEAGKRGRYQGGEDPGARPHPLEQSVHGFGLGADPVGEVRDVTDQGPGMPASPASTTSGPAGWITAVTPNGRRASDVQSDALRAESV